MGKGCIQILVFFQSEAGWEEYYDYIFPDETAAKPNLKLLAMAKMWKKQQPDEKEEESSEDSDQEEAMDQTGD